MEKKLYIMEELIQAVKVLVEQQQRTQQCLQEELIAISKEQLEILKTNKGNPVFPYVVRRCSADFLVMVIQFTILIPRLKK